MWSPPHTKVTSVCANHIHRQASSPEQVSSANWNSVVNEAHFARDHNMGHSLWSVPEFSARGGEESLGTHVNLCDKIYDPLTVHSAAYTASFVIFKCFVPLTIKVASEERRDCRIVVNDGTRQNSCDECLRYNLFHLCRSVLDHA